METIHNIINIPEVHLVLNILNTSQHIISTFPKFQSSGWTWFGFAFSVETRLSGPQGDCGAAWRPTASGHARGFQCSNGLPIPSSRGPVGVPSWSRRIFRVSYLWCLICCFCFCISMSCSEWTCNSWDFCVYDVFQAPPKALSGELILNTLSQPFPSASMPSAEKIPAALPVTNCPLCELMITNVKGVLWLCPGQIWIRASSFHFVERSYVLSILETAPAPSSLLVHLMMVSTTCPTCGGQEKTEHLKADTDR